MYRNELGGTATPLEIRKAPLFQPVTGTMILNLVWFFVFYLLGRFVF